MSANVSLSYFNSIKVQLIQNILQEFLLAPYYFNSIKVQLIPKSVTDGTSGIAHFNSIKVQLILEYEVGGNYKLPFQFHKGTINTRAADSMKWRNWYISIP